MDNRQDAPYSPGSPEIGRRQLPTKINFDGTNPPMVVEPSRSHYESLFPARFDLSESAVLVRISPWAVAAEPRGPGHSTGDTANPAGVRSSRRRERNPSKAAEADHRASCTALRCLAFPSSAAGDDVGDGRLSKSIAPPGRAPQSSRLATIDFPAASRTRGFRCVARAGPARRHSDPG